MNRSLVAFRRFRTAHAVTFVASLLCAFGCGDAETRANEVAQAQGGAPWGTGGTFVGSGNSANGNATGGISSITTGGSSFGAGGGFPTGGTSSAGGSGGVQNGSTGGSGGAVATGGSAGSVATGGSAGSVATGGTAGSPASGGTTSAGGTSSGGAANTGGGVGGAPPECGAFPAAPDLSKPGPLTTSNATEGTNCQIYRPVTLGDGGVRHPVILWGNGTAGPTFVYGAAFDYWASYGFIVAAGNSSNGQGSGAEMLGCLDYLTAQNAAGGKYEGKVCITRVGASGHSQGGGGALMAGRDPRLTTTAPLMPYIAQGFGGFDRASITAQRGPMLLLSGTADTIAPPDLHQKPVFDTTNVPVFWANLVGGDHVAVSLNGLETYRNVMLAWYRLLLMGDETFRPMFYGPNCTLCAASAWQVQRKSIN